MSRFPCIDMHAHIVLSPFRENFQTQAVQNWMHAKYCIITACVTAYKRVHTQNMYTKHKSAAAKWSAAFDTFQQALAQVYAIVDWVAAGNHTWKVNQ